MGEVNRQQRGCHEKHVYLSEIAALVTARARESKGAPPLRQYKCQFCGFWHLTKRRQDTVRTARSAVGR